MLDIEGDQLGVFSTSPIHSQTSEDRRSEIFSNLTDYCRLDTLAMVVLADRLVT